MLKRIKEVNWDDALKKFILKDDRGRKTDVVIPDGSSAIDVIRVEFDHNGNPSNFVGDIPADDQFRLLTSPPVVLAAGGHIHLSVTGVGSKSLSVDPTLGWIFDVISKDGTQGLELYKTGALADGAVPWNNTYAVAGTDLSLSGNEIVSAAGGVFVFTLNASVHKVT